MPLSSWDPFTVLPVTSAVSTPQSLHLTWRSSWGLNEVKVDFLRCHNSSKETDENGEEGATGAKGLACSEPNEIVS